MTAAAVISGHEDSFAAVAAALKEQFDTIDPILLSVEQALSRGYNMLINEI